MAAALGKPLARQFNDADRAESDLERFRYDANGFSETHGKWSNVKSELHESANAIFAHWKGKWSDAESACKAWKDWADHPALKKAIGELGDTDKLRAKVIAKFETDLKETASLVRQIHRSTSFDYSQAKRQGDKIQRGIDNLDKIKGTDRRAGEIVSKWPRIISDYGEALKRLSALKQRQYKLDELPGKCKAWEDGLVGRAKDLSSRKDLLALRALVNEAKETGGKVRAGLKKADDAKSTRERERDDARRFSASDGGWRSVSDNLKESASGVFNYWEKALATVHRSCDEIAKGAQHVEFARYLEDLEEGVEDKIKALTTKVNKYVTDRRAITKLDAEKLQDLINDICRLDIESSSDASMRKAKDMTDDAQRRALASYDELLKRHQVLVAEAEKVAAFPKGEKLLKRLRDDRATLDAVKNDGTPAGMNNPRIAATTKYGQSKHKEMQSKYDCTEIEFSAGGGRADCVHVPTCMIWEFKPSSHDPSETKGQVDGYLADVDKAFKDRPVAKHCWADGKDGFKTDFATYPACK